MSCFIICSIALLQKCVVKINNSNVTSENNFSEVVCILMLNVENH